jgi:16S rRNA processing protein RimM
VGVIRKAHGIKGECFVMPATDDVAGIYAQGREFRLGDSEGYAREGEPELTISLAREFKGGLIVRFAEVPDRNAAESLRGLTLLLPAQDVRPLEEGEFFLHDLVGLRVETAEGEVIGKVGEVYEAGAGHFLSVVGGERDRLIPFTSHIVREVDVAAGRIVIEAIPGLLEI